MTMPIRPLFGHTTIIYRPHSGRISATRKSLAMPTTSLRTLAQHLDVPERTLRRAAAQGLVHGRRASARRFETSLQEEAYLREHWSLLSALRGALRTEQNVRLTVLFGSLARGRSHEGSDIDLLVATSAPSVGYLAAATARLERKLDRDVQLVRLQDAEETPLLMLDALERGRVLIDRDNQWSRLVAQLPTWRQRAADAEPSLVDAMEDLDDGASAP